MLYSDMFSKALSGKLLWYSALASTDIVCLFVVFCCCCCCCCFSLCSDHYKHVATDYNASFNFSFTSIGHFIQQHVAIDPDDQVIDIGGGTGEVSFLIKREKDLRKPVVCVDPSQDMLDVAAQKDGVIGVKATAEEFFSMSPVYSMDVVLMVNCVHHFTDYNKIFSKLALAMPKKGVCMIVTCDPKTLPYFRAAKDRYVGLEGAKLQELCDVLESNGLELKMVSGATPMQLDKRVWFNCLRNRHDSGLWRFSDEELEKGLKELEAKYNAVDTLNFDFITNGFIITKKEV